MYKFKKIISETYKENFEANEKEKSLFGVEHSDFYSKFYLKFPKLGFILKYVSRYNIVDVKIHPSKQG